MTASDKSIFLAYSILKKTAGQEPTTSPHCKDITSIITPKAFHNKNTPLHQKKPKTVK